MNNIFSAEKISRLKSLCRSAERIAIVSHSNPDGDAMGSGLALLLFLKKEGFENVRFFLPNRYPHFLSWIDGNNDTEIFNEAQSDATAYIAAADLIIMTDFNTLGRLEKMAQAIEANLHAKKVLIDHHIDPPEYDLVFSDVSFSSTAHIVYCIIQDWAGGEAIDLATGYALYTGMTTDTGSFSYGHLSGDLFRAVADLLDKGVDPVMAHSEIYDTMHEGGLRMTGYLIYEKMKVFPEFNSAYITLTNEEKKRFDHQPGDTEGIANIPMSISGIRFSMLLTENADHIKVSLRSKGDFDVNELSRKHFNGGGHKNAAGGKLFSTMPEAIAFVEEIIRTNHP